MTPAPLPGPGGVVSLGPGVVYGGLLLAFLVAVRSRLPWTLTGGGLLAALVGAVAWRAWKPGTLAGLVERPGALPALASVALSAMVMWWTLHREQLRMVPPEPIGEGGKAGRRLRLVAVALGVALVTMAAAHLEAPLTPLGDGVGGGEAKPAVPWFLAGLALLRTAFAPWFVYGLLPFAVAAALWLAPHLETSVPETAAPFGGRRDEVPFFLFAWLFLGVVPIAMAVLMGVEASPARPLSERLWNDLLGLPSPSFWPLREVAGLLILGVLFGLLPWKLPTWKPTRGAFGRHQRRLGPWRYGLAMLLVAIVILVPLGLLARWWLEVGSWLHVPELGFFL
ncbi:MAG: hypothetical protein MI919_43435 [Holophagales bacterium]|nr:hypothetical protein [Holophagales bacterium]